MIFCYVVSLVLLVGGIVFFTGKGASYIKGFKAMEDEEKESINIKALCRNVSLMFFIAALIFALAGYSEAFREAYFKWFIVGWFILCTLDTIFISKSKRYDKNPDSRDGEK